MADGKWPAYQFYPKDFYSDEHVELMTNQQQGCYLKLLSYQWINGSIPGNVSEIALICREPVAVMRRIWPRISKCFGAGSEEGTLVNARMERDRVAKGEYIEIKREAGRAGAEKRWHNHSTPNGKTMADPMADPMAKRKQKHDKANGIPKVLPIAKNSSASASLDADVNPIFCDPTPREKDGEIASLEEGEGKKPGPKFGRPKLVNAPPPAGDYLVLRDDPGWVSVRLADGRGVTYEDGVWVALLDADQSMDQWRALAVGT